MLAEMTGIDRETVCKTLVEDLKNKKVCVRCVRSVPHLLTRDQKYQSAVSYVEFVEMIDDDRNVLKRIVTGDENWCFMYDPETKRQSAAWLSSKKPKAQKRRMQKSCVKTMLTAFFMLKVLFITHCVGKTDCKR
jgi:hypothetical protein